MVYWIDVYFPDGFMIDGTTTCLPSIGEVWEKVNPKNML